MASSTIEERELVIVQLQTDTGLTGVGEFLAAPYFSGETQASAIGLFDRVFDPVLRGADPLEPRAIMADLDARVVGNQFAKAAVEMALQDLRGRYFERPVADLLGGRMTDRIELVWHIGSGPADRVVEEAEQAIERGFDTVKLKVGKDPHPDDLERVKRLREAIGPTVAVHLDANQAWSVPQAIRCVKDFAAYDVSLVEQPVARWDRNGLVAVAAATDTPILADEGVYTDREFLQYLAEGPHVLPGIKVSKAGGIAGAMRLVDAARSADLPVVPLAMPGETAIATAAMLAVASTLGDFPLGSGISDHRLVDRIVTEPIETTDGRAVLPDGPGLGVELDRSKLDEYARD